MKIQKQDCECCEGGVCVCMRVLWKKNSLLANEKKKKNQSHKWCESSMCVYVCACVIQKKSSLLANEKKKKKIRPQESFFFF